jgi:catechol 2,3-dioxygenase-like lactoylglutathione lyase family enzyme
MHAAKLPHQAHWNGTAMILASMSSAIRCFLCRTNNSMNQRLVQIALVVLDYDEAIDFYTDVLGFDLVEDKPMTETKRWVVVKPKGDGMFTLLLAKAVNEEQRAVVGNQAGGRVFLFLHTDNCRRDFQALSTRGVLFVRPPADEPYGTVAVFRDLYGNLWDLIQPAADAT